MLWVLFFCYATSAALLFQKLVLPRFFELHAGLGLLNGDSIYFHSVATEVAERIRLHGWGEWSIYPTGGATGNVAILAALYVGFGNDPSLIIPVNAAIHALSGLLLYQIGKQTIPTEAGKLGGLVAAVLFVFFPSALNWYGQLHKDGYAIAGVLLLVWAWLRLQNLETRVRDGWTTAWATVAAIALIAMVRPYYLIPLSAVMICAYFLLLLAHIGRVRAALGMLLVCALSVGVIGLSAVVAKNLGVEDRYGLQLLAGAGEWRWSQSTWVPRFVDDLLATAARTRARFIVSGVAEGAGSMIDVERVPRNAAEVVGYLPRGLQIALFAPFPDQWFEKKGLVHRVALLEMLAWYVLAPGVLLCLLYASPARSLLLFAVAILFLIIYGFMTPNVGTLYRVRSVNLFLLVVMGTTGWLEFARSRWPDWFDRLGTPPARNKAHVASSVGVLPDAAAGVIGAGLLVAAFTAIFYFGLFARDALLARWYGTGAQLDAYFVATAVPTFIVAVVAVPLGTMLTAQFLEARHQQSSASAQALLSRIGALYAGAMALIIVALTVGAAPLLGLLGWDLAAERLALARTFLHWMLPVLALSGFVVMGNAILNALGSYAMPAAAQLVVPALSVAALLAFGPVYGIVAAIAGMLAGQIVNLGIVALALARKGISLMPAWGPTVPLGEASSQYAALVAAATLTSLAVPVNLGLASTVAEGGAATLGLGGKMVAFVAGILSAAVATIILPRFAAFMAQRQLLDLRAELSFLLLAATALTIPMALILFIGSEDLVRLAFGGGAFGEESVSAVSRVMKYGIIQLPFLTVNLLILKYAIATRMAGRVFVAALLTLCFNVALDLLLMEASGVAGIALATTISIALATFLMLLLFYRLGHVSWMDVLMLSLNWMPYTTFIICIHYKSYAGAVVSMISMAVLFAGHWSTLTRRNSAARA